MTETLIGEKKEKPYYSVIAHKIAIEQIKNLAASIDQLEQEMLDIITKNKTCQLLLNWLIA